MSKLFCNIIKIKYLSVFTVIIRLADVQVQLCNYSIDNYVIYMQTGKSGNFFFDGISAHSYEKQ